MTKPLEIPFQHVITKLRTTKGSPFAVDVMAEAADRIKAAIDVHTRKAYWKHEDEMVDDNGEETEPEGYVCLHCSRDGVEEELEDWELDLADAGVTFWPCPTVQALGFGGTSSDSRMEAGR